MLGHPRLRLDARDLGGRRGQARSRAVYPALAGATDLAFTVPGRRRDRRVSVGRASRGAAHGGARRSCRRCSSAGVTVIDLSADYRLDGRRGLRGVVRRAAHRRPNCSREAVYGLPELDRSRLPGARLVACPGCYPTATTLAALPALESGRRDRHARSWSTRSPASPGPVASASAGTHYVAVNESVAPYKVGGRIATRPRSSRRSRRPPAATSASSSPRTSCRCPAGCSRPSTSTSRTGSPPTRPSSSTAAATHDEPFVHVHDAGDDAVDRRGARHQPRRRSASPSTSARNTLVAACAIDNLGKGAAGPGDPVPQRGSRVSRDRGSRATGPVV